MAKYDEQLERMNFLMEYKNQPKEVKSNIEYHANGADGKVYGILREGTKYYIKTTESGKENIAESYDYINGFINRRENEYKSYNEATKHLELKLMSLNEAYGKKSDVSTVDFKRGEKVLANLTEEARKELDRMNQIFENSCKIGRDCVCDPESKGSASPENTEKNNDPFDKKVTPDMDYAGSKGTVEESGDGSKVADVSSDLQSDKMKTKNSNLDSEGNDKEYKDAHDDLDGEGVADKDPKGAKVVHVNVNEGMFEQDPSLGFNDELDNLDGFANGAEEPAEEPLAEPIDEPVDAEFNGLDAGDVGQDIVGGDAEVSDFEGEDDLDSLLEAFLEEEDAITGPNDVLDKEDNPINGTDNGVDDEKTEEWKRIEESEDGNVNEPTKQGDEDTMKNYQFGYNDEKKLDAQSWDKMSVKEQKAINRLVDKIFENLVAGSKKKPTLEETIHRIVNEEITKLDVWGKHPKYGKEPMTHPEAKEVLAGTADRDFNDDSAKGSERYGKKIGDGKPFDKEVIDLLTDQVLAKIKGE